MSDNNKHRKVIFMAELVDGKRVEFTFETQHIPTLDYIVNELDYHIIELRAMKKTQEEIAKKGIIQKATTETLKDLLNRGRKR